MAKRKSTRKRKLQLVDNSPIDLNESQRMELRALYRHCGMRKFPRLGSSDRETMRRLQFERLLFFYIEMLCHDAAADEARRKRRTVKMRRDVVESMGKLVGRSLSPSDIIKRLSSIAPLPQFAADAIRRDFLRATV
jgi:hypothetical protein